jgi:hypothetical protein
MEANLFVIPIIIFLNLNLNLNNNKEQRNLHCCIKFVVPEITIFKFKYRVHNVRIRQPDRFMQ